MVKLQLNWALKPLLYVVFCRPMELVRRQMWLSSGVLQEGSPPTYGSYLMYISLNPLACTKQVVRAEHQN